MGSFYLSYEYWIAFTQLVLAMAGMGATLRVNDFVAVAKVPNAFFVGIGAQLIIVPLLVASLLTLLSVEPGVAVGLAILAAIPGGSTSNIFTHFARGNTALSIALSAITTVACLITVPIVLKLLISSYVPDDFQLPAGRIAGEITVSLLIPLFIGMLILRLAPAFAAVFSRWCVRGSLAVIAFMVVGASMAGRLDWQAFGIFNALLVLFFVLVLTLIGWIIPMLFSLSKGDVAAVDIELAVRNVNLGVLIKASLFPATAGVAVATSLGNMALFTLLIYGAFMMVMAIPLVLVHRHLISQRAV